MIYCSEKHKLGVVSVEPSSLETDQTMLRFISCGLVLLTLSGCLAPRSVDNACPISVPDGTNDAVIAVMLIKSDPKLSSDPKKLAQVATACGAEVTVERVDLN